MDDFRCRFPGVPEFFHLRQQLRSPFEWLVCSQGLSALVRGRIPLCVTKKIKKRPYSTIGCRNRLLHEGMRGWLAPPAAGLLLWPEDIDPGGLTCRGNILPAKEAIDLWDDGESGPEPFARCSLVCGKETGLQIRLELSRTRIRSRVVHDRRSSTPVATAARFASSSTTAIITDMVMRPADNVRSKPPREGNAPPPPSWPVVR
jgi:hypothetical protein